MTDWHLGLDNVREEHGFRPLELEGRWPAGLVGTLYRNVPGQAVRFGQRARHWFDGDAAVVAHQVGPSGVLGAVKMLKTPGYVAEEQAGKRLFSGYGTPVLSFRRELMKGESKNWAGTSLFHWREQLYATCEGGRPLALTAELETLGPSRLDDLLVHNFSAHPHWVPEHQSWFNFGTRLGKETVLTAYQLPAQGPGKKLTQLRLNGATLVHDFAATAHHLVFFIAPLQIFPLRYLMGLAGPIDCARWRPEQGTEVIVVPLAEPERPLRFRIPAFLAEHVIDAQTQADTVQVRFTHYPDLAAREGYLRHFGRGQVKAPLGATTVSARLDLTHSKATLEPVFGHPAEFPTISPRAAGGLARWAYLAGFSGPSAALGPMDCVHKIDLSRGQAETWAPGPGQYPSETIFVPRPDGAAEDQGWLLTLVLDTTQKNSYLAVLDADKVSAGPVATARWAQPIPLGFHGLWVGA